MTTHYAQTKDGTALAVEASDLGWPVGRFPERFAYLGVDWELLRRERNGDGDLVAVHYDAPRERGKRLVVFND